MPHVRNARRSLSAQRGRIQRTLRLLIVPQMNAKVMHRMQRLFRHNFLQQRIDRQVTRNRYTPPAIRIQLQSQKCFLLPNILPFTCMPGTVVAAVSHKFKKDHNQLPYVSIAYDGQEDASIDLRLQEFMHQAKEYSIRNGYNKADNWHISKRVKKEKVQQ